MQLPLATNTSYCVATKQMKGFRLSTNVHGKMATLFHANEYTDGENDNKQLIKKQTH